MKILLLILSISMLSLGAQAEIKRESYKLFGSKFVCDAEKKLRVEKGYLYSTPKISLDLEQSTINFEVRTYFLKCTKDFRTLVVEKFPNNRGAVRKQGRMKTWAGRFYVSDYLQADSGGKVPYYIIRFSVPIKNLEDMKEMEKMTFLFENFETGQTLSWGKYLLKIVLMPDDDEIYLANIVKFTAI